MYSPHDGTPGKTGLRMLNRARSYSKRKGQERYRKKERYSKKGYSKRERLYKLKINKNISGTVYTKMSDRSKKKTERYEEKYAKGNSQGIMLRRPKAKESRPMLREKKTVNLF